MILRLLAAASVTALALSAAPASADPGDFDKKLWEKRADCDKKLAEADSRRDFEKTMRECDRELAKLHAEQRGEIAKARREAYKKWHKDGFGRDDD